MLRHKDTTIVSEIKDFFTSSQKAVSVILDILSSLKFSDKHFGFPAACNLQFSSKLKLMLLILFPFFQVNDPADYAASGIYKIITCGKDVFYRLLSNCGINWRHFSYSITRQLIKKSEQRDDEPSGNPRCLIIDDTDFPKTGKCFELIGKVFSHVTRKHILGYKALFLGFFDGKSFFSLDFSLHGEKGKNEKKPYGLTKKELKNRFAKKRDKASCGQKRVDEYFTTKIASAISMTARAIKQGIRFDYVLCDSWFTCFELIKFITKRRIRCHLLGMAKNGTAKYVFNQKELTAKEIAGILAKKGLLKRSKLLGYYYSSAVVSYKGIEVKLFFCKASKRGSYNILLTTNKALNFNQAYKIYANRWSIEVFFRESKQHLQLGKCQSQDFDAQIAAATLCMLQYNLLVVARRFSAYQTTGGLFREIEKDTLQLTISEHIWQIIIELVAEIAEILNIDPEELILELVSENQRLAKFINLKPLRQAG